MNTASRFTVNTLMTIVFMNVDFSKHMTNSNAYLGINLQFLQGKYCRILLHEQLINIPCQRNSNFIGKAYMELSVPRVFNFYFGPKLKVTHQNWGPRSSRYHFSILGLKNQENSNGEKIQ